METNLEPGLAWPGGCALYRYNGFWKKQIHASKFLGDLAALRFLKEHALEEQRTVELIDWAQAIVPVPSSLKGRLRGQLDLAWLIADALARVGCKPLRQVPWRAYWYWHKRSETGKRERLGLNQLPTFSSAGAVRVLVVDDVLTSGVSMANAATKLGLNNSFRYIALADAYSNYTH